jgi:hypothetical protein
MLLLNPETVRFGAALWPDVAALHIDRASERLVVEWSDAGPFPTFADVPEQRVTVQVTRRLVRDALLTPRPGEIAELAACTAPTAGDALRRRIRALCVVTHVAHELSAQRGALQVISFVAISADGAADPVISEDASDAVV